MITLLGATPPITHKYSIGPLYFEGEKYDHLFLSYLKFAELEVYDLQAKPNLQVRPNDETLNAFKEFIFKDFPEPLHKYYLFLIKYLKLNVNVYISYPADKLKNALKIEKTIEIWNEKEVLINRYRVSNSDQFISALRRIYKSKLEVFNTHFKRPPSKEFYKIEEFLRSGKIPNEKIFQKILDDLGVNPNHWIKI